MEKKEDFQQAYNNLQEAYRKQGKEIPFASILSESSEAMKWLWINFGRKDIEKKRLVAEVTEDRGYCVAGYKKGDKLVFNLLGMFLPDESSVKVACTFLLHDMNYVFFVHEALFAYNVEIKEPYYYSDIECSDPGPPWGGGHIKLKLYIE